jgi:ABC-type branched-subunit amino acid transport system substrate-binding protein
MRALVNFASTKPELKKSKLGIVLPEGSGIASSSFPVLQAQAAKSGWQHAVVFSYVASDFAPDTIVEKLRKENPEAIFLLGSAEHTQAFIQAAARAGWYPNLFMPAFSFRDVASVPKEFKDKVFISFPTIPSDVTTAGSAEFTALRQKYKLPEAHVASQLTALAAAKLFVATATSAGRDLTREKLIKALEAISNFDTGLTPKITFGPKRRIGARGAYILSIDVDKKMFSPGATWVEAN